MYVINYNTVQKWPQLRDGYWWPGSNMTVRDGHREEQGREGHGGLWGTPCSVSFFFFLNHNLTQS